ncbi:hypothetical protein AB0945_35850 [Streptomyces sp. NPDC005474]|uniref:hypothetical protein n=1 Tax=Streptomyces sp. NPDC005474 TaxID=3154878 RepID=UPI0034569F29
MRGTLALPVCRGGLTEPWTADPVALRLIPPVAAIGRSVTGFSVTIRSRLAAGSAALGVAYRAPGARRRTGAADGPRWS